MKRKYIWPDDCSPLTGRESAIFATIFTSGTILWIYGLLWLARAMGYQ